jgi:acyl carrier protein
MEHETLTTLQMLAREVGKITGAGSAPTDISLTEIGVDSLNVIELMVFCEQLYGVFDPEKIELTAFTTLADLDRQLHQLAKAAAA